MILYLKDHNNFTRKLLGLMNTFSKVAGNKINIQKLVDFLYTNNEKTKKGIRNAIQLTFNSPETKYP
jgi:ABC-type bacteriocin/lantibiotic exporter with double-glycine peptidase domain